MPAPASRAALYGISAFAGSSSGLRSRHLAGFADTGVAASINATVTNDAGASVAGSLLRIRAFAGGSSVFNASTISGGTAAIQFGGAGNTLTLAPGSVISGNVLGTGSDTFQLGGSGTATFDVCTLGPAAQYQGFGTFNKIGGFGLDADRHQHLADRVNVQCRHAGGQRHDGHQRLTVNAGGTLAGNGTVGNTTINGGVLAPGNARSGCSRCKAISCSRRPRAIWSRCRPRNADRTNVTGTATLGGATVNAIFRGRHLCGEAIHHPQRHRRRQRHLRLGR